MVSFAEPRLRRRLAALTAATRVKIRRRQSLRDKARAEAVIAAALARLRDSGATLNPAEISAVRYYRDAVRSLTALGDSPELRRADAAFIAGDPELAAKAAKEAAHLAEWTARYPADRPPPSPDAAPFAWYAWSLAQTADHAPPED